MIDELDRLHCYGHSWHFGLKGKGDSRSFTRLEYDGMRAYWYELIETPPAYMTPPVFHPIDRHTRMWQHLEDMFAAWLSESQQV